MPEFDVEVRAEEQKKALIDLLSRAREILRRVGPHGAPPPRRFRVCPKGLVNVLRFLPPSPAKFDRAFSTARSRTTPAEFLRWKLEIVHLTVSTPQVQDTRSTVKMPPKKAARPAQENISLGPQIREGELVFGGKFRPTTAATLRQRRNSAKMGG